MSAPQADDLKAADRERRRIDAAMARIHDALDVLPQESWSASEAESIAAILDGLRAGRTATHIASQTGRRLQVVK
ncbi:hypothetical protein [Mycobacteroides abscessus]|uniref:hypothetical protein n=1 Tax=Mycobacteroides abscessus TaxID=36809 RepID=UPI0005DBEB49|nr:hypothetical protein [Mycobacteroides abscessus]CPR83051.1 Uncharacterised protein [Mycobacteroides abscessus]